MNLLRELLLDAVRYNERPDVKDQLELEIEGAVDQRHLEDLVAQRTLVRQGMDAATVEQLRQQMERAMAKRIHPHDVHDFFIEAFKRLGGMVNPREKGRYEITCVPPLLMDRNQQIGIGLPVQPPGGAGEPGSSAAGGLHFAGAGARWSGARPGGGAGG